MLFTAFFLTVTISTIIYVLKLYSEYKQSIDNQRTQVTTLVLLVLWIFLVSSYIDGIDAAQGIYLSSLIAAGTKARFVPLSLLEHRTNQIVEVVGPTPGGTDAEWVVRFDDGFMPYVYEDELTPVVEIDGAWVPVSAEYLGMPVVGGTPEEIAEKLRSQIEQGYVNPDDISF